MDLKSLQQADEADVEIVHPVTGKKLGIAITVYGIDSPIARAAQNKLTNKRLARGARGLRGKVTAEEIDAETLEYLASLTKRWKGVEDGGHVVAFSMEAAVDIYQRFPWLRKQIDEAVGDRELFFPTSAPASAQPSKPFSSSSGQTTEG